MTNGKISKIKQCTLDLAEGVGLRKQPENNAVDGLTAQGGTTETKRVLAASSNLPLGGTTGLCHQSSSAIDQAAEWYRANRETCERPIVPALRRRFGLSALEVCHAIRRANGVQ